MEEYIKKTLLEFLSKNIVIGIGFAVCKSLIDKYELDKFFSVISKMEERELICLKQINDWSLLVIQRTIETN